MFLAIPQCPSHVWCIGFRPPAVQFRDIEGTVDQHLHSTGSTCLPGALGRVNPDIRALYQLLRDVHVVILERKPIYVLGPVRNAGTFKYTPGMIVLQALADAGGLGVDVVDTSRAIESIRETEHLRQGEDRFDRLLVKQARLIAQRDGLDAIMLPASIRSKMLDPARHDGGAAGFGLEEIQAVRVFADLVPSTLLDLEPGAIAGLLELERAVALRPEYLALAAQLHVLATT